MGAHKDKELVDKIIRKIEEEDYTDYMERTNKVKNTKAVIEAYKRQRDEDARQRRMAGRKEYQQQIIMQREEKQMLYQQEKDAEAEARRRVQEEEAFKLKVVEAARQRLLAQHAHVVSGFAPKGTMAKIDDLELVGNAAQGAY